MYNMLAVFADQDREVTLERSKLGMAVRKAKDGETGGKILYRYTRSPDGVVINDIEASNVNTIYKLRSYDLSLRKIASHLNFNGSSNRSGRPWLYGSIQSIL